MEQRYLTALIVLPLTYNPDKRGKRAMIEIEKFEETMKEIAQQFGGGTLSRFEREAPRGYWWNRGVLMRDELAAIEVDIPDDATSKEWLKEFARTVLALRFQQKAIYIKLVGPIEVLLVQVDR